MVEGRVSSKRGKHFDRLESIDSVQQARRNQHEVWEVKLLIGWWGSQWRFEAKIRPRQLRRVLDAGQLAPPSTWLHIDPCLLPVMRFSCLGRICIWSIGDQLPTPDGCRVKNRPTDRLCSSEREDISERWRGQGALASENHSSPKTGARCARSVLQFAK